MNVRRYIGVAAAALLLVAGTVSAQTVPSSVITVGSNTTSVAVTPGTTSENLGTLTFSAPTAGNVTIASIPVTVTAAGDGNLSDLSNCQLFNQNGSALTTGNNVINTVQGTDTFMLDMPLTLQTSGGVTTLTIECNISSSTPTGSSFQFVAGAPMYAPGLRIDLVTAPTATAGMNNDPIAAVTLDASQSGQNVSVSSFPFIITTPNSSDSYLSGCSLRNASDIGTALNNGTNAVGSFSTGPTITLDTPLTVPVGSTQVLVLECNVSPSTPVGSTFQISVSPDAISATNSSTGASITPAAYMNDGEVVPTSGTLTVVAPSTTGTTPISTSGGTTPTVPNTGAGGNATENLLVLALAAAIGLAGVTFFARQPAVRKGSLLR